MKRMVWWYLPVLSAFVEMGNCIKQEQQKKPEFLSSTALRSCILQSDGFSLNATGYGISHNKTRPACVRRCLSDYPKCTALTFCRSAVADNQCRFFRRSSIITAPGSFSNSSAATVQRRPVHNTSAEHHCQLLELRPECLQKAFSALINTQFDLSSSLVRRSQHTPKPPLKQTKPSPNISTKPHRNHRETTKMPRVIVRASIITAAHGSFSNHSSDNVVSWSSWSPCSVTCGKGQRQRTRVDVNRVQETQLDFCVKGVCAPNHRQEFESDSHTNNQNNNAASRRVFTDEFVRLVQAENGGAVNRRAFQDAAVGGGNSEAGWTPWSPCSASCGNGKRSRERTNEEGKVDKQFDYCTEGLCPAEMPNRQATIMRNPQPATTNFRTAAVQQARSQSSGYGGTAGVQQQAQWAQWSQWAPACAPATGGGGYGGTYGGGYGGGAATTSQTRSRTCSVPNGCSPGQSYETRPCDQGVQKPAAEWGQWSAWGGCSVTCGMGRNERRRTCSTNDNMCFGQSVETRPCNAGSCATWSQWGQWSTCDAQCGQGKQMRTRTCTGGQGCAGGDSEMMFCEGSNCGVASACTWSMWFEWSPCSTRGQRTRSRNCDCPQTNSGYGNSGGGSQAGTCSGGQTLEVEQCSAGVQQPYRRRNWS